uniref:Serpentine receptor class gamma n=1 Tax=Panagrolaimus sp. PS1159 TaxID=55785 RepID=A0AC35FWX3_9BILA
MIEGIANGIVAGISLITAIISAIFYYKSVKKNSTAIIRNDNTEQKLILQAIFASFTYVCYSGVQPFKSLKNLTENQKIIFKIIAWLFQHTYHLSAYVLLFVFSSDLRKQLLRFYGLSWLIKKLGIQDTAVQNINHTNSNPW